MLIFAKKIDKVRGAIGLVMVFYILLAIKYNCLSVIL